jgi:hypothetical protein
MEGGLGLCTYIDRLVLDSGVFALLVSINR